MISKPKKSSPNIKNEQYDRILYFNSLSDPLSRKRSLTSRFNQDRCLLDPQLSDKPN